MPTSWGGGGGGHWKYLNNEFEHDPQMVSANYVGDLVIPNVQAAIRFVRGMF